MSQVEQEQKAKLIITHFKQEGNHWSDIFWGIYPVGSNICQNNLGKILMKVREEFRR